MLTTLESVEQLVAELTPPDQPRLLRYLAPKVADAVLEPRVAAPAPPTADPDEAWKRLLDLGKQIAALVPLGESATELVSQMRR